MEPPRECHAARGARLRNVYVTPLSKLGAVGKTVVILTDNVPLALATTKRRASSSHLIQSCRVVCVLQPVLQHCHTSTLDSL